MNKRLFFSISLVLVLCLASNASAGMIGWWKFDDSTANDSGPGGHHGTLISGPCEPNMVTFVYDTGLVGSESEPMNSTVAYFPGTESTWINLGGGKTNPEDPCTWADIIGNNITIAAWIKVDGSFPPDPTYQYVFAKEDAYRVSRYSDSNDMRVYLDDVGGTLRGEDMYADDGQWHHYACVYDGTEVILYWDGEFNVSDPQTDNLVTDRTWDVTIGGNPNYEERTWKGWIDDVRLYDTATAQATVRMWARNYKAFIPVPEDGATYQLKTLAEVSWSGMPMTYDYRVYLGTDETLVANGDASVDKGEVDVTNYSGAPMGDLELGTIYYWRVDSNRVGGVIAEGDVWQFETKPAWAENPWPFDGCKYVPLTQQLSWSGGGAAIKHEVYFSTNEAWVTDACDAAHAATIVAPDPCVYSPALAVDTTYYWKADSNTGTRYTPGQVWSFSTDATSPEPGLVGYYPMEEEYGGSSVTWDISGNMHHGTLVQGDPSTSIAIVVDAERGNVLKTDTPGGVANSAVDLGGNADDVHDPCWGYVAQNQVTVMLWAKPEETHGTDYIYTRGNNVQIRNTFEDDPPEPNGPICFYSSTLDDSSTYGADLKIGEWQHIAITWENYVVSDCNVKKVYVNGALTGADYTYGPEGGIPLDTHENTLVIGGRLDPEYNDRGYDGLLDDVKIYDILVPCWKIVAEGTQCATCVGDLDGNGVVNLQDLNQLIGDLTSAKIDSGQWKIIEGDPTTGVYWKNCSDMDGNDEINLADLNRMIGNLTWEEIMTGTPGTWSYPCGNYCP